MRVLIATGIYPPEIGGPATYAKLLSEELPKRDIEVDVLPFREVRMYPKIFRHVLYVYKIIMRSRGADIIFTQDPVSTGLPAIIASKLVGKKVFMRVAGDYAWEQGRQRFGVQDSIDEFQSHKYGWQVEILRSIQSFTTRHAHRVITPSNYFSNLVSGWNDGEKQVSTIYNGIDLAVQFERGDKYEQPTIITAGRLVPWKGVDTLIRSLPSMPGWNLQVAGDGEDKTRLIQIAKELNVEDRVEFLGMLPRDELFKVIYRSHVFALLSTFESFSFQTVEAMNVGAPVIVADIGNLREIITDKVDGLLVPAGDTQSFVESVLMLEGDAELKENLIQRGRERAQHFSIQRTVDALAELFQE